MFGMFVCDQGVYQHDYQLPAAIITQQTHQVVLRKGKTMLV